VQPPPNEKRLPHPHPHPERFGDQAIQIRALPTINSYRTALGLDLGKTLKKPQYLGMKQTYIKGTYMHLVAITVTPNYNHAVFPWQEGTPPKRL
jgi:hypothetical protein